MCWDKLEGTTPADQAPCEWGWTSLDIPPLFIPHLWRGGMRKGKANIRRQPEKYHPTEKPVEVMQRCLQVITPGRVIVDPFMGSGSTLVACVLEGRPCIGIEREERFFQTACKRVQEELQQLTLFA